MTVITLLIMVLMHIIEDFHLQGKMGEMKQKIWWAHMIEDAIEDSDRRNGKKTIKDDSYYTFWGMRYKQFGNDYIPVLLLHGFEWSMFIHIPVLVARVIADGWVFSDVFLVIFTASVLVNAAVHSIVDHLKANRLSINLIVDQTIHMLQVAITFAMFCMVS